MISGCRVGAVLVGFHVLLIPVSAQDAGGYEPYGGIIRGTEGADPVALQIRNDGSTDLRCTAALAHWYSETLGVAGSGRALDIVLWHDPATGVINLLNAQADRMPLEAIWCDSPAATETARGRVALPFSVGPTPARLLRSCAPEQGKIVCTSQGE